MDPDPNPYRSPDYRSPDETFGKGWLVPVIFGVVGIVGILFIGLHTAGVLIVCGSMIWLFARSVMDGAYSDPILLITGVSLMIYVIGRWDRAKISLLFCLGGFAAMILGSMVIFEKAA